MSLPPERSLISYTRTDYIRGTTDDVGIVLQGGMWGSPQIQGPGGFVFRKTGRVMSPYDRKKVYFGVYSGGADQSWTVPDDIYYIYVKIWGAGGGGGCQGGWTHGGEGGAGGHTRGLLAVSPGVVLSIRVADGGVPTPFSTGTLGAGGATASTGAGDWPGYTVPIGTPSVSDNRYCAGGGGYAGIFIGSIPIMIAGGGGGGGSHNGTYNHWNGGGAGGGTVGQNGMSGTGNWSYEARNMGGGGGSQSGGGYGSQAHTSHMGAAGGYLAGGSALSSYMYGGSGGGGYYGGGAGSHTPGGSHMTGGGGGSGFVHPRVMLGETFTGHRQYPPMTEDPDFPTGGTTKTMHAHGGDMCNIGGDGLVIIYY
jgi:hypothetical protein